MRGRCSLWRLVPVFLLGGMSGCLSMQRRPVTLLIQDAETKKPIAAADVRIWYPLGVGVFHPPAECTGKTDASGLVPLWAMPYGEAGIMVAGAAKGYLASERNISVDAIKELDPVPWFGPDKPRPVSFVVELFAEPRPAVDLIIPNGYRGLVKVSLRVKEDAPCVPGQRLFSYQVPLSGIIEIHGPPLLRRFYPPEYRAQFVDGTRLPRDAEPTQVGLRWLKYQDHVEYFVVGTQADFEHVRSLWQLEGKGDTGSTRGGPSPGRGRGHHKGGGQSSPPSN